MHLKMLSEKCWPFFLAPLCDCCCRGISISRSMHVFKRIGNVSYTLHNLELITSLVTSAGEEIEQINQAFFYWGLWRQLCNKVFKHGKVINHLYYADGLMLFSPNAQVMQKLLTECEKYAHEHGMKFNEYGWNLMKRRVLYSSLKVTNQFKANPSATLYHNGSILTTETSYKYLSHILIIHY